jgi:hypothetical protein
MSLEVAPHYTIASLRFLVTRESDMLATEIQEHARKLLQAHGDKAVIEAAQKAKSLEESGSADDARTWRRIEAALKQMRGPRST